MDVQVKEKKIIKWSYYVEEKKSFLILCSFISQVKKNIFCQKIWLTLIKLQSIYRNQAKSRCFNRHYPALHTLASVLSIFLCLHLFPVSFVHICCQVMTEITIFKLLAVCFFSSFMIKEMEFFKNLNCHILHIFKVSSFLYKKLLHSTKHKHKSSPGRVMVF